MPVHAARGRGWSSSAGRVLSGAVIGPLAGLVPPGLVDEVLAECGAVQRRFRRLPARFGVYFVLGLCLFRGLGYPAVLRQLVAGLEERLAGAGWEFPSPTALSATGTPSPPLPAAPPARPPAAAAPPGTPARGTGTALARNTPRTGPAAAGTAAAPPRTPPAPHPPAPAAPAPPAARSPPPTAPAPRWKTTPFLWQHVPATKLLTGPDDIAITCPSGELRLIHPDTPPDTTRNLRKPLKFRPLPVRGGQT